MSSTTQLQYFHGAKDANGLELPLNYLVDGMDFVNYGTIPEYMPDLTYSLSVWTSSSFWPPSPFPHLESVRDFDGSLFGEQQCMFGHSNSSNTSLQNYSEASTSCLDGQCGTIDPRLLCSTQSLDNSHVYALYPVPVTGSEQDNMNPSISVGHSALPVHVNTLHGMAKSPIDTASIEHTVRHPKGRSSKLSKRCAAKKQPGQQRRDNHKLSSSRGSALFSPECYLLCDGKDLRCHHPLCQSPGRTYSRKHDLLRHIETHFVRFRCDSMEDADGVYREGCGKSLSRLDALTRHRRRGDCPKTKNARKSVSAFSDDH
ncbi:hypothetical protein BD410DRAFT_793582 [Rickenella mellea]|uniref:Uncharacterized protein n=1 Tax=Rickenella mellea TaxID=50990 RepID=A0A4Y7PU70_9AGAM|nr:hypothetical protein BD410DRAFT_793582 [Rickenella mellea]